MNNTKLAFIFLCVLCALSVFVVSPAFSREDLERDKILDDLDKELKPSPVPEVSDPMIILNRAKDKMQAAEDSLSRATNTVADPELAKKEQQEVIDELNKMFEQIKNEQKDASVNLEKVIKMAQQMMQSGGKGKPQKNKPKPQKESKPKPKPKPEPENNGPAERAYDAQGDLPDKSIPRRSDGIKWGNLPPKLRDEIIQSAQEDFLPEYQERLRRYYRILAGKE